MTRELCPTDFSVLYYPGYDARVGAITAHCFGCHCDYRRDPKTLRWSKVDERESLDRWVSS